MLVVEDQAASGSWVSRALKSPTSIHSFTSGSLLPPWALTCCCYCLGFHILLQSHNYLFWPSKHWWHTQVTWTGGWYHNIRSRISDLWEHLISQGACQFRVVLSAARSAGSPGSEAHRSQRPRTAVSPASLCLDLSFGSSLMKRIIDRKLLVYSKQAGETWPVAVRRDDLTQVIRYSQSKRQCWETATFLWCEDKCHQVPRILSHFQIFKHHGLVPFPTQQEPGWFPVLDWQMESVWDSLQTSPFHPQAIERPVWSRRASRLRNFKDLPGQGHYTCNLKTGAEGLQDDIE